MTHVVLDSTLTGQIHLLPDELPNPRGLSLRIAASIGGDELTGIPTDLAFDNQRNLGALENVVSAFSGKRPAPLNGKNLVRQLPDGVTNTSEPSFLFISVRGPAGLFSNAVDVIELESGRRFDTNAFVPGTQSIPVSGAALVMDYFRQ